MAVIFVPFFPKVSSFIVSPSIHLSLLNGHCHIHFLIAINAVTIAYSVACRSDVFLLKRIFSNR